MAKGKYYHISISTDKDLNEKLRSEAKKVGRTLSNLVCYIVREYLKEKKEK